MCFYWRHTWTRDSPVKHSLFLGAELTSFRFALVGIPMALVARLSEEKTLPDVTSEIKGAGVHVQYLSIQSKGRPFIIISLCLILLQPFREERTLSIRTAFRIKPPDMVPLMLGHGRVTLILEAQRVIQHSRRGRRQTLLV